MIVIVFLHKVLQRRLFHPNEHFPSGLVSHPSLIELWVTHPRGYFWAVLRR